MPVRATALQVGVGQLFCHAVLAHRPQASEVAGRSWRAAVLGERVEEGVGGGVVALAGAAEGAGDGGEQDEGGEVVVAGELVQVPGGVGLGCQDGVEVLGGEGGDGGVVEDAGGVDDAGERGPEVGGGRVRRGRWRRRR